MIENELIKQGYSVDPATGFLMKDTDQFYFGPKQKSAFLKALKINGNQSKSAHDVGVSYREVLNHLKIDIRFKEAFEDTLLEMRHTLEGKLYQVGLSGRGVKQAETWLKAHFPAEYKSAAPKPGKGLKSDSEVIDSLYGKLDR